jgi:glutamate-1-semialdehyde aminotransferase
MLIVMFNGAYHGIFDEVIVRGTPSGKSYPAASGIPPESVANTLILDYGTDESLRVIRERADELAAVLVEPVQSRRPDFQPAAFLRELRTITERAGCALIFDEVITGFRIGPGGAQAHFNVRADLATYGKIIGGGMPIGAIAGASRFMDALDGGMWRYGDDSIPEVGVTYFAGTFVRHPVALAAAKAALGFLKERGPELQRDVNQRTERLVRELNEHFDRVGAPVHIPHFGSLFKPHVDEDLPFGSLFFHALRRRGVHIWEGRPCFLTVAHDDEDVAFLSRAFRDATAEMQQGGFFPTKAATQTATTNATTPASRGAATTTSAAPSASAGNDAPAAPVPGARLGKDPDGKPAWFAPDPDRPGKYVRIGAA